MAYLLQHRTRKTVSTGNWYPLGASVQADGVNFAIYSQYASEVFLLLFDDPGADATDLIKLEPRTRYIWHSFVPGLKPGQLYGYKIRGEYNPARGMRFNENKLLIDPYAKALTGKFRNADNLLLAYEVQSFEKDRSLDSRDNTAVVPKCVVMDDRFDWHGDTP